jgi:two-component system sensor histidine kinase KdpD
MARLKSFAWQIVPGMVAVGLVTGLCRQAHLEFEMPSLLFLVIVVLQSLSADYLSAVVISVLAVACLDYFFLPPVFEWTIDDPKDTLFLFTYLITSLVITRLASRARNETRNAENKRRDVTLLYRAASQLLSLEPEIAAGICALRVFRDTFNMTAACLFDAGSGESVIDGKSILGLEAATRAACVGADCAETETQDKHNHVHVRCFRENGKPVGAVGFEGFFEDEAALAPLFALAGTAFERARTFRAASEAAAATQAEMLRSAILDALAHEFKTPQAVIMTAAGTLRETGDLRPDQLELTDQIEREVDRMSSLTTGLLRMARLDQESVRPRLELTGLSELMAHLAGQYRSHYGDHAISMKHPQTPMEVLTDPDLIKLAVVQLLDNACKYSPSGGSVEVELGRDDEFADVFISNDGNAIRPEEDERIFERSYRGVEAERGTPGTGLGLYVARKIIRAHGGNLDLWRNRDTAGKTTFRIRLPLVRQGAFQ